MELLLNLFLLFTVSYSAHSFIQDAGSFIYFRIFYTSTFFILVHTIIINILFGYLTCNDM